LSLTLPEALPTAEPKQLILADRPAGIAPKLVATQRGYLRIEEVPRIERVIPQIFPGSAVNLVASALCHCRYHGASASHKLGCRITGLGPELVQRLEWRQNGEDLVLDVLQIHAVNEIQVVTAAESVHDEVPRRHRLGDITE